MTRKDYVLLAQSINSVYVNLRNTVVNADDYSAQLAASHGLTAMYSTIDALTKSLRQDNPRFDGVRFYEACTEYAGDR